MLEFVKHLVTCNCVLKQYEDTDPPVFHKFVVFSVINEDGSIKPSHAKCNNCGGIHKVTEVGVSQKLKRETIATLPDIEEIKSSLPERLVALVEKYKLSLPSWQEIKFVLENEKWERPIILQREEEGEDVYGKYLVFYGKTLWKVDNFSSEEI
jgi:hypothetical protein